MQKYGKTIVAVLGLIAVFLINARTGGITPIEWAEAGVVAGGALTVYAVPLVPQFPAVKTVVALFATLAAALVGVLNDGWSGADAAVLVTEVLVFFGIAIAPATSGMTRTAVSWGSDARVIDGGFREHVSPVR